MYFMLWTDVAYHISQLSVHFLLSAYLLLVQRYSGTVLPCMDYLYTSIYKFICTPRGRYSRVWITCILRFIILSVFLVFLLLL